VRKYGAEAAAFLLRKAKEEDLPELLITAVRVGARHPAAELGGKSSRQRSVTVRDRTGNFHAIAV
jgi:hypothetical protein